MNRILLTLPCPTARGPRLALLAILVGLLRPSSVPAQQVSRTPVEATVPFAPIVAHALGRSHLVYELHLTNFGPRPLVVRGLATFDADRPATPLDVASGEEIAGAALRVGVPAAPSRPPLELEPGRRTIVYRWVALADGQAPPSALVHRLVLGPPGPGPVDTLALGSTPVSTATVAALEPPVPAGRWVAVRGPSNSSGHRTALVALQGRVRVPQRFAVDWVALGADGRLFHDGPAENRNWYGYGQPVRAAAPGTVVRVREGIAENTPLSPTMAVPIDAETATGNLVVVRGRDGRFATYAHLRPGSLAVREGDVVEAGATLGQIGNSGNSLAPHLHFQLGDSPEPLAGEGLPFVMRSFQLVGRLTSLQDALGGAGWQPDPARPARTVPGELPLEDMIVEFQ